MVHSLNTTCVSLHLSHVKPELFIQYMNGTKQGGHTWYRTDFSQGSLLPSYSVIIVLEKWLARVDWSYWVCC